MDAPSSGGGEALRSVALAIILDEDKDVRAAATVIAPTLAVTNAQLEPARSYRIFSATEKEAAGELLYDLPDVALTLVRLTPGAKPLENLELPAGSYPFETIWPGSNGVQGGTLNTTAQVWAARFDSEQLPLRERIAGTPVVLHGSLAGIFGGPLLDGRGWSVIPAGIVLQAVERRAPSLDRFTPSARRALTHAFAAAARDEIHMADLVAGLHENAAASPRRFIDSRGVSEPALWEAISTTAKRRPLHPAEYELPVLAEMPPLSQHVTEAIGIAVRMAAAQNEPQIRARHLLYGVLSVDGCSVRDTLESLGLRAADIQMKDGARISGYVSDVAAEGPDHFGIQAEARALAMVLGAKKVEPPIAVGLLGTWGSGKSYFMHEMRRQFRAVEMQGRDGDGECCSNIVQIWFNAWHYIDSNLWASLTSEIFDALDHELTERAGEFAVDDPVQERAKLLADSARAESQREKAAAEKAVAEKELAEIEEKRRALDDVAAASQVSLLKIGLAVAGTSDEVRRVKADAEAAAKDLRDNLGIDRATVESLQGMWGGLRAAFLAARKKNPVQWKVTLAVLALTVVIGAAAAAAGDLLQEMLAWSGIATLAAVIASAVHLLKTYQPLAKDLLSKAQHLFATEEALVDAAKQETLARLDAQDRTVAKRLADAARREEEEVRKIRENEQKLIALKPTQKMKSYVRERRESADYTQHLGVIAKAHEDFARLSEYLRKTARDADETRPLVDRIVLYIDDLDRCPEAKVVEVLQAVHLLLAFELFVVVVGVDSRWLLHSLKTQMTQFSGEALGDGADALDRTLWESTPINYLEKIFQIPLTLRPMQPDGFEYLIADLTKPANVRAEKKPRETGSVRDSLATAWPVMVSVQRPGVPPPDDRQQVVVHPEAVETRAAALGAASRVARASHLTFTTDEIKYMQALYPLMPSPRGAKRFVNLYRLLRGLVDEYRFESLREKTEEHQAVLLLLAMLIGYPEETCDVLQELHDRKRKRSAIASPWWTFVSGFAAGKIATAKGEASLMRWKSLHEKLEEIRAGVKLPDENRSCAQFIEWAEHVARFSFHSGRIVSDYRTRTEKRLDVPPEPKPPTLSVTP